MKLVDTDLPEVKRVVLDIHRDARGFFCERFAEEKFAALGIREHFVQDNHSRSLPGVLRGLHFQYAPMMGKLVGCTRGRILDVAVDVRPSSPNFGRHAAAELSDENGELLWIPAGFAHGFCVLGSEAADVLYKVTNSYNANGEQGIRFDDADIGIAWPVTSPLLSDRDRALPTLAQLKPELARWFA